MEKLKYLVLGKRTGRITTLAMILINVVAFTFLPDKMGVHFSGGVVDGEMPKLLFVVFMPLVNFLISLYMEKLEKNPIITNIFLLILNCALILVNLI
ncbi:MAG: DUF1648 domain-containing protein [Sarcina sp.]